MSYHVWVEQLCSFEFILHLLEVRANRLDLGMQDLSLGGLFGKRVSHLLDLYPTMVGRSGSALVTFLFLLHLRNHSRREYVITPILRVIINPLQVVLDNKVLPLVIVTLMVDVASLQFD